MYKNLSLFFVFMLFFCNAQQKIYYADNFGFLPTQKAEINTININKLLKSLKGGGVVKIRKAGTYYIKGQDSKTNYTDYLRDSGGIELQDNISFILGPDVTLAQEPTSEKQYNIIRVFDKKNVVIEGGQIIGDRNDHQGINGEWGYGIAISGGANITIKNITIKNLWGDGINLQCVNYKDRDVLPNNIKIQNVISTNNRRQGMSIEGGTNITVSSSEFSKSNGTQPESGVNIEPWYHKAIVDNVKFENCKFVDNNHAGLIGGGNAKISNIEVSNSEFRNNKISGSSGGQCTFYRENSNINVKNCSFFKGKQGSIYGVSFFDTFNSSIINNSFENCTFNLQGVQKSENVRIISNKVIFTENYNNEVLFMNHDRNEALFNKISIIDNEIDLRKSPGLNYQFYFFFNNGELKNNKILQAKELKNKVFYKGKENKTQGNFFSK
ncbi:MAG: right-handed parallel beta-helix repeat-containing protein [Chryseobacterium jejuense]|uniref:right-handed parallel beta-helix repeat-containing protein n=1 Tax=Chryseobacterium jejuense TaxID=445960 RepID=UPI003D11C5E4